MHACQPCIRRLTNYYQYKNTTQMKKAANCFVHVSQGDTRRPTCHSYSLGVGAETGGMFHEVLDGLHTVIQTFREQILRRKSVAGNTTFVWATRHRTLSSSTSGSSSSSSSSGGGGSSISSSSSSSSSSIDNMLIFQQVLLDVCCFRLSVLARCR